MNKLHLRQASADDGQDILELHDEIGPEDHGFTNFSFGFSLTKFQAYLAAIDAYSRGEDLPEGFVPQSTFWLMAEERPVGISRIRHCLSPALLTHGGHIGYFIRPSERGKGYGREILRLSLQYAEKLSISRVLITCCVDNQRSRRVIVSNQGVLERIDEERNECYYWVEPGSGSQVIATPNLPGNALS